MSFTLKHFLGVFLFPRRKTKNVEVKSNGTTPKREKGSNVKDLTSTISRGTLCISLVERPERETGISPSHTVTSHYTLTIHRRAKREIFPCCTLQNIYKFHLICVKLLVYPAHTYTFRSRCFTYVYILLNVATNRKASLIYRTA